MNYNGILLAKLISCMTMFISNPYLCSKIETYIVVLFYFDNGITKFFTLLFNKNPTLANTIFFSKTWYLLKYI